MLVGFALIQVLCTPNGDCSAEKAITDDIYTTREQCMSVGKRFNEKYIVCGEVRRDA